MCLFKTKSIHPFLGHLINLVVTCLQLNPPPSEALKRMHMLAADPGIIAIMNKVTAGFYFSLQYLRNLIVLYVVL